MTTVLLACGWLGAALVAVGAFVNLWKTTQPGITFEGDWSEKTAGVGLVLVMICTLGVLAVEEGNL